MLNHSLVSLQARDERAQNTLTLVKVGSNAPVVRAKAVAALGVVHAAVSASCLLALNAPLYASNEEYQVK